MKFFTGNDVSLRSVSICVVDESGEFLYEAKVAADIDVIVTARRRFSSDIGQVGFEAGALTQYPSYVFSAAGYEVVCMEARQVAASLAAISFFSPHSLAVGAREQGCLTCEYSRGEFWGENVVCQQGTKLRVI